ncbi:ATPase family AAA domain-containing protein 2-like [Gasterosteus aculeatus]
MVTFRTGSRGDPDVSIGPHRKNPKPGTRRRDAREETPGLSHPSQGTNAEEEERDPDGSGRKVEDDGRAVAASIRKSQRRQNAAGGGGRSGLRRSSRPVNPVSRYQTSGRSVSSRADASVLKKRLVNDVDSKSFSEVRKRRRTEEPPQVDISSFEKGGLVDEDRKQEAAAEDNSCEVPRATFKVGGAGPSPAREAAFRLTDSETSDKDSDDDKDSDSEEDSEDEERSVGKVSGSRRPLGLLGEDLLETRRDEKMNGGAELADIDPAVGFDSIGGLAGHILALKEMVVFPLLYPEVFDNFKIQPPRGCLFYGPPGTGKTLVARALASECSHGNRKVSFFMRKGADCLCKWVGESERQLQLLFEQAHQMRPSIIFFDEMDGLAPVRSSRQDQIHSSIVSTLLALMDGLDSRGEVVVIGATNRLDAIDPALRRPGRFDREFLFGLPDRESRKEILKIHTRQWRPGPSDDFLEQLAERCVGYCGADIRGVCTEAALCALRRRYPQIYGTSHKLLLDVSSIAVGGRDFLAAMAKTLPASRRCAASPASALSAVVRPLLGGALRRALKELQKLFPHAEQGVKRRREPDGTPGFLDDGLTEGDDAGAFSKAFTSKSRPFLHFSRSAAKHPTSHRPRMLLGGPPASGQTSHLAPALLHALERFPVHNLDSAVLFGVSGTSPEEACAQVFCEARRTAPSILYLPHMQQWWEAAGSSLRASFLSLLAAVPSLSPILLLATCSDDYQELDPEIQALFREEYGEVHIVSVPTRQERSDFFQDLLLNQAAEAPPSKPAVAEAVEVLPLAPMPRPRQLPERERLRLEEQEEDVLRDLRLFLRYVTESLAQDRRFKAFAKPVDTEEVPDYTLVVKAPMDLSTLLTNIDEQKYVTVDEFVCDADLIWKNALEYNPDSDPMDRHIRHRACALRDALRSIIRAELNEGFQRACEEIRASRTQRASSCWTKPEEDSRRGSEAPPERETSANMAAANMAAAERKQPPSRKRLDRAAPPLLLDQHKLRDVLKRAVDGTEGFEVEPLEKLHALLAQCIYRHRNDRNKKELLQEMKEEIASFVSSPAPVLFK